MGAYAGPLLLLLVGVGGLVVGFGRRLRKLREEGTESAEAFSQTDGTLVRPPNERGLGRQLMVRLRDACTAALRAAVGIVRGTARLATRLLQRPPVTLRVPRLALPSPLRRRLMLPQRGSPSEEGTEAREVSAGQPEAEVTAPLSKDLQAGRTSSAFEQSGEEGTHQTAEQVSREDSLGVFSPERRGDDGSDDVVADTPHVLAHFPRSVEDDHSSGYQAEESKVFEEPTGSAVSPTASMPQEAGEIFPEASAPPVSFLKHRHDDSRAEGGSSAEGTMSGTASPREEPRTAAFEEHVRERVGGRRKVVGRVRMKPARASASKSRRQVKGVPSSASERGAAGVLQSDAARTPPEGGSPLPEGAESVPALLEGGDLEKAEEILVNALADNPRDLEAYRLLGVLYIRRGDFGQAREVLEEALRRDPEETSLYGFLGETYFALGGYGKSLQMYQRAHDADEKNVGYLEQLLRIATLMDRRPLVRVTAEKILALEPNHPEAKKQLARATVGG